MAKYKRDMGNELLVLPSTLDLGCGADKQPGAYGVDKRNMDFVDELIDLDIHPWDLPDDHFQLVYAIQVLEHLANRVAVMEDLYRICAHGALVYVELPWGSSPGWDQDPTHQSVYNLQTFLYFSQDQWVPNQKKPDYTQTNFQVLNWWRERENRRFPWGKVAYKDNLTVILQVIKESSV